MLHVAQYEPVILGQRLDRRQLNIPRVYQQQCLFAGGGNAQHRFAVAQHVLEQLWLGLDQVQGIAVVEQVA